MDFVCQEKALEELEILAEHKQHGVLLVGDPGSGKTYLARQYAKMLGISDFYIINPAMADLKTMISTGTENTNPVVFCIENLDNGVYQASFPLLKLIEDCPKHIYVVVTCNNYYAIPDTIPSRCALVTIDPPTRGDIGQYAKSKDATAYEFLRDKKVWKCIKGFGDVDTALKFTPEHLKYFEGLEKIAWDRESVSNASWKLQHYEDKSETPLPIVVRYLLQNVCPAYGKACLDCLNDLALNRISKNAILSKLVFELKYTK